MPKEPSQPKKSIFDHPEIPEMNSIQKIVHIAGMLSMRGVYWDSGIWIMPTTTTNLLKEAQWISMCEQENLKIVDITKDMDPNGVTPSRKYFKRERTD